jgi:hypothetical protein
MRGEMAAVTMQSGAGGRLHDVEKRASLEIFLRERDGETYRETSLLS